MSIFGVMGHLYAWATPEYMLNNMSWEEITAYLEAHCPKTKKKNKSSYEPPDRDSFKKHYPEAYKEK
jgi:hypothetical protein